VEPDLWVVSDEDEDGEELAESMVAQHFPEMRSFRMRCPECVKTRNYSQWAKLESSLFALTIHLNDDHRWDRNRIADFLEGLDVDLSFKVPEEYPF